MATVLLGWTDLKTMCPKCGQYGHEMSECLATIFKHHCKKCGRWGHESLDCPELPAAPRIPAAPRREHTLRYQKFYKCVKCYRCHVVGSVCTQCVIWLRV